MNILASSIQAKRVSVGALVVVVLSAFAATASAQLSTVGGTTELVPRFTRAVDAAYDPNTNRYLVVGSMNSVSGVCVNADGKAVGGSFEIKPAGSIVTSNGVFPYAGFVRTAYSQHANSGNGGFLVVWAEEQTNLIPILKTRMVTCAGPIGTEQIIDLGATAWAESGPAVAYSATSQRFLVVWPDYIFGRLLRARLVDLNAAGVGNLVTLSTEFARDPGVTWNPVANEFGVSFSSENQTTGQAYSGFARVPATNPSNTNFFRQTWNFYFGGLTTITDIDYNPSTNRYVMAWWQFGGLAGLRTAEFDAAGNLLGDRLVASNMGSYDAMGMSYNPVSGTHLAVGLDIPTDTVVAAELDGSGNRTSPVVAISTSAPPARYPRVRASTTTKTWNSTWSARFESIANQIVQTTTTGTGTTPTPPPPAPVPTTAPRMNVDLPAANATVAGKVTIAGWALDAGAPSGTGVDVIHVWVYPVGGTAWFGGAGTYGGSRPDVGAAFGSRFTPSGYALDLTIPTPGAYDLVVYARSTLTGTFNNVQIVRVQVPVPVSKPRMWVDYPAQNQNLSQNIFVAGWAIDLGSSTNSGVDAVHVYGYPLNGGAPIFVGAGTLGGSRPDVGAAFGSARFNGSGFSVQGTLPRGDYNLVVYARSSVANSFNNVFVVFIRVL
jgi:hypothetical protein